MKTAWFSPNSAANCFKFSGLNAPRFSLLFVPHWNNTEGGAELDTSHCFVGRARFEQLRALLAEEVVIAGVDEHTALVLDFAAESCRVMGRGGVTLLAPEGETRFGSGQSFSMKRLGRYRRPAPDEGLSQEVWQAALVSQERAIASQEEQGAPGGPPPELLALAREREAARARRDWAAADKLRQRIAELGWQIADTPDGPRFTPLGEQ